MSYQIITYDPDTGGDEHGDYKTQREAQQALKQYRQEAGALIYDLDRWRIVLRAATGPPRHCPLRGGVPCLIILFFWPSLDDYMGVRKKA